MQRQNPLPRLASRKDSWSRPTLPSRGFLSVFDPHFFGRCWRICLATPAVLWRLERGLRKERWIPRSPVTPTSFGLSPEDLASFCGSDNLLTLEAAIMATIPTLATSKVFTFLIASRACRLADLRRIRTVTAVADTEAQARAALAGLPLVFLSRTPTGRAAA